MRCVVTLTLLITSLPVFVLRASAIAPPRVTWIGFSAGVVGGILAARQWHQAGYPVDKFIAMDGWGVPLGQRFPIYRMAHDPWTHHSQNWMGQGLRWMAGDRLGDRPHRSFVADPPVSHLDLWRSPDCVPGYVLPRTDPLRSCTAADCIRSWIDSDSTLTHPTPKAAPIATSNDLDSLTVFIRQLRQPFARL